MPAEGFVAALRYARTKITELNRFEELDLQPHPGDSRNLYGMLLRCEKKLSASR